MKDIKGFEKMYRISKDGKVWAYPKQSKCRWKDSRFLKTFFINKGKYEVVCLYKDRKQKKFLVHRLVALNYIPNPLNLTEVNHKNANSKDNRLENLEWVTSKQNKEHAIALGLYKNIGKNSPKGIYVNTALLNPSKVRRIRELYSTKKLNGIELAKKFNVTKNCIYSVVSRKNWKHIV